MKRFTTARPAYTTYVQWDGNNIEEFEALTGEDWPWLWWANVAFVDNGDLELYQDGNLIWTIPLNWWSAGPGSALESLNDQSDTVLDGTPPFNYVINGS